MYIVKNYDQIKKKKYVQVNIVDLFEIVWLGNKLYNVNLFIYTCMLFYGMSYLVVFYFQNYFSIYIQICISELRDTKFLFCMRMWD